MDLLHWHNLNKNIKFEPTKKQYFNRYLWRLVYEIKKISLATDKYVFDIPNYVREKRRIEHDTKKYPPTSGGYYGYYYKPERETWEGVDEVLIDRVRTITNTFKDTVKFRSEHNTLQVYAETEDDLKRVASAICADEYVTHINSPKPGTEDALRNGHVYMSKINYKYKVILRDGNYDTQTKQSIWNQLSQRDDVKIPPQLKRELSKKYPALWGAYFYTNDDSIITILALICPSIVGKIHPIDQLQ